MLWNITILFQQRLVITLKWNTRDVLLVFKPVCLQINGTPLSSPLSKSRMQYKFLVRELWWMFKKSYFFIRKHKIIFNWTVNLLSSLTQHSRPHLDTKMPAKDTTLWYHLTLYSILYPYSLKPVKTFSRQYVRICIKSASFIR